jgi:hypothetical protein
MNKVTTFEGVTILDGKIIHAQNAAGYNLKSEEALESVRPMIEKIISCFPDAIINFIIDEDSTLVTLQIDDFHIMGPAHRELYNDVMRCERDKHWT